MTQDRWNALMLSSEPQPELTLPEFEEGWHWCPAWDGLLVGPGMAELAYCNCTWKSPAIQATVDKAKVEARKLEFQGVEADI